MSRGPSRLMVLGGNSTSRQGISEEHEASQNPVACTSRKRLTRAYEPELISIGSDEFTPSAHLANMPTENCGAEACVSGASSRMRSMIDR